MAKHLFPCFLENELYVKLYVKKMNYIMQIKSFNKYPEIASEYGIIPKSRYYFAKSIICAKLKFL